MASRMIGSLLRLMCGCSQQHRSLWLGGEARVREAGVGWSRSTGSRRPDGARRVSAASVPMSRHCTTLKWRVLGRGSELGVFSGSTAQGACFAQHYRLNPTSSSTPDHACFRTRVIRQKPIRWTPGGRLVNATTVVIPSMWPSPVQGVETVQLESRFLA